MMNKKEKARLAAFEQVIVDLLVPHGKHKPGCLTHQNGPCQCGWSDTQIRYNFALTAAKAFAAKHDYDKDYRDPVRGDALFGETR